MTKWNRSYLWVMLIPFLGIAWVWLSSLSFVPVPWPDDSAFYFPAKHLFSWPPRWVMLPQAPFESTYREWNFNTMPLFPILIGILRALGIDGSLALKVLPLGGWFLSVTFLIYSLRKGTAPIFFLIAFAFVLTFDPIIRWSSVLIRPESLIGAMGMIILFGYRFGFPRFLRERRYFHPVALCLWVGAMLHFNAIHLLPLVLVLYVNDWRKIIKIGAITAVGLIPWIITILIRPKLFLMQMELQFNRLTGFKNPWLSGWREFTGAILPDMGAAEGWSEGVRQATIACVFALPFFIALMLYLGSRLRKNHHELRALIGAFAWFVSSLYLWHSKAEVWFTHYMHLSFWAWLSLVLFETFRLRPRTKSWILTAALFPALIGGIFFVEQVAQAARLEKTQTWHWKTYDHWIDCIDSVLIEEHRKRGSPATFRVWDPTFPDITVELSKRHPTWDFTRTNDFHDRWNLGVAHGHAVDAMVVTETFRRDDQYFKGELATKPEVRSVWMNWEQYFLIQLERDPRFKPRRMLCQAARWDAFIYLNSSNP